MALGVLISLGLAKVGIIVASAKIFRRKKCAKLGKATRKQKKPSWPCAASSVSRTNLDMKKTRDCESNKQGKNK